MGQIIKKALCSLLAILMITSAVPVNAIALELESVDDIIVDVQEKEDYDTTATALIISQPDNWEYVSKSDPPKLKWNKISGAPGYLVTIKNDATGEYYTEREKTTKNSYSLGDLFDDKLGSNEYPRLKIWVCALNPDGTDSASQAIIYVVVSEYPDISFDSYSSVTSDSVTLKMTINKDYGSPLEDSGFYIGTSSSVSKMTKYSFADYGSYSATTKGTKTMTITGLNPDTKYYVRAYAENGVGEEYTSTKNFTTEEDVGSLSLSQSSVSWGYGAGNEANITVTCSGSYSLDDVYYKLSPDTLKDGHDYEWLSVTKSGNTINLKPKRPNYSKYERTAEVTVISGSQTKDIIIKQAACGESAPTLTLKRGNTVVTDGMNLGTFTTGQPVMEAAIVSSNVRKVSAQLRSVSGTMALDTSTDLDKISLDISDLPAGDYKVTVYASNSETANDYWSQSPFGDGSMEFYFTLIDKSSGGGGSGESGSVDTSDSRFSKMGDEYLNSEYFSNLKGVVLTGNGAEDIIRVARSQKGYKEDSNGASAYARFYGATGSVSWCAYFVSWCAGRAEIDNSVITLSSGASPGFLCPYGTITLFFEPTAERKAGWNWTKTAKIIENASRSDYEPKIGDLIFFDWDSKQDTFDHVGIVTGISGNYISYIDGNNSAGTVAEHTNKYLKTNTMITAYARPNYSESSNPVVQTYTVTYDANGGSGAPSAQTKTEGKALTLSSKVPTWSGYIFQGWATSKTATTAQYQPGGSYTKDADVTLYAVWKAEEHKHSFSEKVTDPTCTEKGYTTYTCSGCGYSYVDNYVNATGHSLGDWYSTKDPTCTEKGKEQRDCYNCSHSETREVKATGHSFGEWEVVKEPTGTEKGEERRECKTCGHYETREIPALGTYTVTYDANGGSGAPAAQTKTEGKALTLSSKVPTRSGYTFLGWATSKTATTAQYQPRDSYTADENVTLYAVWKQKEVIPEDAPTIMIGEVSGRPGEMVKIPVTIKNNPGFAAFDIIFEYDKNALEIISFESSDVLSSAILAPNEKDSMVSLMSLTDINENGVLFYVNLLIKDTAEDGSYAINATGAMYNTASENIGAAFVGGKITVKSSMPGDVDCNGVINSLDAMTILRYAAKILKAEDLKDPGAADFDGNGIVNSLDAMLTLRKAAHLD